MKLDDVRVKAVLTVLVLIALALAVAGFGGRWSIALLEAVITGALLIVCIPLWRNRKRR